MQRPALLCPEIDAFDAKAVSLVYDAPSTGTLHVAATKACHDRFVAEGVDLSAYNTLENIEDFVDLRKAAEGARSGASSGLPTAPMSRSP